MDEGARRLVVNLTIDEMVAKLNSPDTRIVDSRMLEMYDRFTFAFQVLDAKDDMIYSVETPSHEALKLFRIQYRNNPRNNPALYGLLDEKAEENVK
jgi:hypothetical protein